MTYKEAVDKAKHYESFINKEYHLDNFTEKIKITGVKICLVQETINPKLINAMYIDNLDDFNLEKIKNKTFDVAVIYESVIKKASLLSDFLIKTKQIDNGREAEN